MSQNFARRLLFALIALALMTSVGLSGFYSGATNTIHPTSVPTPITATPATPTPAPDVWQAIRGCDISYAKVEIAEVSVNATHPESYEGSNVSEVWEVYVFGTDAIDPAKLHDRWDNPITVVKSNATLDDIPAAALAVWIYNDYGYLAVWDDKSWSGSSFEVTGFCHEVKGVLSWATIEELTKLGEYSFTYPTDKSVKNWYISDFTIEVYTGKQLSNTELNLFDFHMRGLHEGEHWAGLGFVGPSSSTHGMFDLVEQNQMVWQFRWADPDYDIYQFTGIKLPLNTEIIVKTTSPGGIELQRFKPISKCS